MQMLSLYIRKDLHSDKPRLIQLHSYAESSITEKCFFPESFHVSSKVL